MIKIALPKGRLQKLTFELLQERGFEIRHYHPSSRLYRLESPRFPEILFKSLHEKDIAVQVAVGNYDLGICGREWVLEIAAKFPKAKVAELRSLGYGRRELFAARSSFGASSSISRIAGEFPNLAESLAFRLRLPRFRIFPLWGAAEAYPPEDADLVILPARDEEELSAARLRPFEELLAGEAVLLGNVESLKRKELGEILRALSSLRGEEAPQDWELPDLGEGFFEPFPPDFVRLALPDGHLLPPTAAYLREIGLRIPLYTSPLRARRFLIEGEEVAVKVVRPQDMPLQVAVGNFDLAITGRDWVCDHLTSFPTSPIRIIKPFDFGKVRVVAVVASDFPAEDVGELRKLLASGSYAPLRIASEYANLADRFAREHHLSPYKVIPTWGATEAFIPEDADILIENTETGGTLRRHNLRILAVLFESTACLVGRREYPPGREEKVRRFLGRYFECV